MKTLQELFNLCVYNVFNTIEDTDYAIQLEGDTLYIFFQGSYQKKD